MGGLPKKHRDLGRAPLGWLSSAEVWEGARSAGSLGAAVGPMQRSHLRVSCTKAIAASACSRGDSVPRRAQTFHVDRPAVSVRKALGTLGDPETLRSDHLRVWGMIFMHRFNRLLRITGPPRERAPRSSGQELPGPRADSPPQTLDPAGVRDGPAKKTRKNRDGINRGAFGHAARAACRQKR